MDWALEALDYTAAMDLPATTGKTGGEPVWSLVERKKTSTYYASFGCHAHRFGWACARLDVIRMPTQSRGHGTRIIRVVANCPATGKLVASTAFLAYAGLRTPPLSEAKP
jgi:hypothetical protein